MEILIEILTAIIFALEAEVSLPNLSSKRNSLLLKPYHINSCCIVHYSYTLLYNSRTRRHDIQVRENRERDNKLISPRKCYVVSKNKVT